MLHSGLGLRRAALTCIGTAGVTGALALGAAGAGSAQPQPAPPPPPGCTAADLAQVSGGVATATSDYLFSHPDVNGFFTSLRGLPNDELPQDLRDYMDANPQVRSDLLAIRQPLTDLRARCDAPPRA